MRVRLKGINRVTKRLADGTRRTYWYAWKGGPTIKGEPGTPEFIASYNAAVSAKKPARHGTLLSLLQDYQASSDFTDLADRTRRDYVGLIKKIEAEYRDFPLSAMTDKRTRGIFKEWRDTLAKASRRQADYAYTVLALILAWGLDHGKIDANPCEKAGRLYRGSRVDKLWTDDDERRFLELAPKHLHIAVTLALWTGQRQGDLLALCWGQYDGKAIRLIQRKTIRRKEGSSGTRVVIPVGAPLKVALDALRGERKPEPGHRILLTMDGKTWTEDGFRVSFRKACATAGIAGVTFHDMRGTAVTRLALAGCSAPEIATLTGHSLRDVAAILDAHYLSRDPALAEAAITKLENARKENKSPN